MPRRSSTVSGAAQAVDIEMSTLGGESSSSARKLAKSVSVPMQRSSSARSPGSTENAGALDPSPNSFQLNSIREAVGDYVGVTDAPLDRWESRRLKFYEKKFKLSEEYVRSAGERSASGSVSSPTASQPVPGMVYTARPKDLQQEEQSRARSVSIDSRKSHRESAFKIIAENAASLITKARLTPVGSTSSRLRRGTTTSSFMIADSTFESLPSTGRCVPSPKNLTGGVETHFAEEMEDEPSAAAPLLSSKTAAVRTASGAAELAVEEEEETASSSGSMSHYLRSDLATDSGVTAPAPSVASEGSAADGEQWRASGVLELGDIIPSVARKLLPLEDKQVVTRLVVRPAASVSSGEGSAQHLPAESGEETELQQAESATERKMRPHEDGAEEKLQQPVAVAAETEIKADRSESMASAAAAADEIGQKQATPAREAAGASVSSSSSSSVPFIARPTTLPMERNTEEIVRTELFFNRLSAPLSTGPQPAVVAFPAIRKPELVRPRGKRKNVPAFSRPMVASAPKRPPIPLGFLSKPAKKNLKPDRVKVSRKVRFTNILAATLVDRLASGIVEEGRIQLTFRRRGVGVFGEMLERKTKPDSMLPEWIKKRMKKENERPYFSYWVTWAQLLVLIASIITHGFGPFSPSFSKREVEILALDQTLITVAVHEKGNIWIGPRFADLILLGAKYTPCMRAERSILEMIAADKREESYTGCCIHTDGICYQAGRQQCPRSLATLYEYRPSSMGVPVIERGKAGGLTKSQSLPDMRKHAETGEERRLSEIVCGLDPDFCSSPSFQSFSREVITGWPLCEVEDKSGILPRHLTCKVQGRPCCIQLQGRCRITTKDYCEFVGGIFHEKASLCSQVNCLHGICGMIPFVDTPNQLYRLLTSLFLHAGLFHMLVSVVMQMVFMRDMETYLGWSRMALIYFIAGIGGNLASAIFVPFNPEVGPSGSHAGVVTTIFVDVVVNREMLERPGKALLQNGCWLMALFVVGLLPWVDNFALLFGTIFGLLATIMFVPDVGLSRGKAFRRVCVCAALLVTVLLFGLMLYVFIHNIDISCGWCGYLNCINWYRFFVEDVDDGNHFCDNQGLTVDWWLPI